MPTPRLCLIPRRRLLVQGRTVTVFDPAVFGVSGDAGACNPNQLEEAYNPNQPRVPRGHGRISGRWAGRGGMSMVAVLDSHYNEVRPQLDLIAEKYIGQPGQKVEVDPKEWSEEEIKRLEAAIVEGMVRNTQWRATPEAIRRPPSGSAEDSDWWGKNLADEEYAKEIAQAQVTYRLRGNRDAIKNHLRIYAPDTPLPTRTIGERIRFSQLSDYEQAETEDIYIQRATPNAEAKAAALTDMQIELEDDYKKEKRRRISDLNDEEYATIREKLGIGDVAADEADTILRAYVDEEYGERAKQYAEAALVQNSELVYKRDQLKKAVALHAEDKPKGDRKDPAVLAWLKKDTELLTALNETQAEIAALGVEESLTPKTETYQLFQFNQLSDEQKAADLQAFGIELPIYTRTPTRFRAFNSEPGGEQDKIDYGHSQKIARLIQQERTIAIAAEKGVDITPAQAERITRELWGAWKSDSGSPHGLALQAASYEELHSHHRKDKERDVRAENGFADIGALLLSPEVVAERKRQEEDMLDRIYAHQDRMSIYLNAAANVRDEWEVTLKHLHDDDEWTDSLQHEVENDPTLKDASRPERAEYMIKRIIEAAAIREGMRPPFARNPGKLSREKYTESVVSALNDVIGSASILRSMYLDPYNNPGRTEDEKNAIVEKLLKRLAKSAVAQMPEKFENSTERRKQEKILEAQAKKLKDELAELRVSHRREVITAGKAAVTAHVRATWESTQYILDRAGVRDQPIETYRAIIRPMNEIEAGNPTPFTATGTPATRLDPEGDHDVSFVKLPDFKMERNGAQSTTLDLESCANTWQGAGGVYLEGPPRNDRVVLRIQTPAASVLSIPVFGQNVYGEQEIVLTGLAWEKWDAWQGNAPPIAPQSREEVIQSIIQQAREKGIDKSRDAAENEADLIIGDRGTFTLE